MARSPCQAGFTLMELLLVLVIMSLVMTLTPPMFSRILPSLTTQASVKDLAGDIGYVKNSAIMRSRQSQLLLDLQEGTYSSAVLKGGKPQDLPAGEIVIKGAEPVDRLDHAYRFRFFADGSSNGGEILIKDDDKHYRILLDWITGRVTVES